MGPRGQEPNESTDDAVWQDLVARLERTTSDPLSVDDSLSTTDPRTAADPAPARDQPADPPRAQDHPAGTAGPRDYLAPEDEDADEGFIPEEPPPLGSGDPLTVLAWTGAAGGPVLLVLFAMFWRDAPLAAILGVLALFLAGVGYLVTKLPKHRDIGDDGAEV